MSKKFIKLGSLLSLLPLLATGCLNVGPSDSQNEELGPNQSMAQTTANQLSSDFYRAVIVDGQYQLGASAGGDDSISSSGNASAFEEGLLRISKEVFPTDQYYMQEGQLLDEERLTNWVSRESDNNPEGLNPEVSQEVAQEESESQASSESLEANQDPNADGDTEGEESNQEESNSSSPATNSSQAPIYLSQILEKNIMTETDQGYALSGIVIGLALNSVYEYTDAQGLVHHQDISVGEMRERGKQYANIIVGRLRNTEQLRSVPIVVGLFQLAPNDSTVGGTYMVDGISREGNAVTDWTERNEYRVALPLLASDQADDQFLYFDNFKNQVSDFFPNLNGISGEALYTNDQLNFLKIQIVSQFYQRSEITALAQHVTDVAQRTLPDHVEIEIRIESTRGTEAYVGRKGDQSQFQHYVFR